MGSINQSFHIGQYDADMAMLTLRVLHNRKEYDYLSSDNTGAFYPNFLISTFNSPPYTIFDKKEVDGYTRSVIARDKLIDRLRSKIDHLDDQDEKIDIVLNETTWLHENRHFHDQLCTPHGFGRFISWFVTYFDVLRILKDQKAAGHYLTKPIFKHVYDNDCNEMILQAANMFSSLELCDAFDNGGFDLAEFPIKEIDLFQNPPDIVKVNIESVTEDSFSAPLPAWLSRIAKIEKGKKELIVKLMALGFSDLTESAASNVQQDILGVLDPDLKKSFRSRLKDFATEGSFKYGSLDYFMTRWIKRRNLDRYNANSLHRLIFGALFSEYSRPFIEQVSLDNSKQVIWKFLSGIANRYKPEYDYVEDITESYLHSLREWEAKANSIHEYIVKATVEPQKDPWCSILKLVVDDIALPAIKYYRQFAQSNKEIMKNSLNPKVYNSFSIDSLGTYWIEHVPNLPFPPISFAPGDIIHSNNDFEEGIGITVSWLYWMMLVSIVPQVMYNKKLICPWRESPFSVTIQEINRILPTEQCRKSNGCLYSHLEIGQELTDSPQCPWVDINSIIGSIKCKNDAKLRSWISKIH